MFALVALVLTVLAGISSAAPKPDTTLAIREDKAVIFEAWSTTRMCNDGSSSSYTYADVGCDALPGQSISINSIADTCRTENVEANNCGSLLPAFIYGNNGCTGTEMQTYPARCYDVRTFYSIKTFRH
ncbi:hypothetical protein V8F06_012445 [Rhypophila decipiens]